MAQSMPSHVIIRELGPREGFQILNRVVPTAEKMGLIAALVDTGVPSIEVASLVRPDRVPQMADAEDVIRALPRGNTVEFTALYLNVKGFHRGENSVGLSNKGWLYSSPSEPFLKANSNVSIEESLLQVPEWVAAFSERGKPVHGLVLSTAFGCEMAGPISVAAVVDLVGRFTTRCSDLGHPLSEVCLADTVGRATPHSVKALVSQVSALGVAVSLHLHDTWGLGMANVFAGLEVGVSIFETSVGGMGGCPFTPGAAGNVASEDVVHLCDQLGIHTGIDLAKYCKAAELAEGVVGMPLPGRVYRAYKAMRRGDTRD